MEAWQFYGERCGNQAGYAVWQISASEVATTVPVRTELVQTKCEEKATMAAAGWAVRWLSGQVVNHPTPLPPENGRGAMKAWLQSIRGIRGVALAGTVVALVVAVSWSQAHPQEMEESVQSPMGAAPQPPQSPPGPNLPYTPPYPTPLAPEQAVPFVPAMPFAGANALEPPVPQVRLRVQAPSRIEPDKEIEYRLTVENVSAAPAHHVLVRDRLPSSVEEKVRAEPPSTQQTKTKDGDTDLLWELGTLKPGEQKVIVLGVKPKGNEDVQNRAYVQFEHGQKVTTRVSKPSVRVKVTAPPKATRYEAISFRIDVANTGDAPLRNIVVNDELPEGLEFVSGKPEPNGEKPLTWKLGDVPPHQTRRIEYQAIVKQTGTFRNNV